MLERLRDRSLLPVKSVHLLVEAADGLSALLGLPSPLHQLGSGAGCCDRQQDAARKEDPRKVAAKRSPELAPRARNESQGRVAERDRIADGVARERQGVGRNIRCCEAGRVRPRTEVGGIVQVRERRAALDGNPPVGGDGPLDINGEPRPGAVRNRVADSLQPAVREPGHDNRALTKRACHESLRVSRLRREEERSTDRHDHSYRAAAPIPERCGDKLATPTSIRRHEAFELLSVALGDRSDLDRGQQGTLDPENRRGEHIPRLLRLNLEEPMLVNAIASPRRQADAASDHKAGEADDDRDPARPTRTHSLASAPPPADVPAMRPSTSDNPGQPSRESTPGHGPTRRPGHSIPVHTATRPGMGSHHRLEQTRPRVRQAASTTDRGPRPVGAIPTRWAP